MLRDVSEYALAIRPPVQPQQIAGEKAGLEQMMQLTETQLMTWLSGYLWPFFRIAAFFMVIPVFTARGVPMQIRLVLAAGITPVIAQIIPAPPVVDLLSVQSLLITVNQVVTGIAMAFCLRLLFAVLINAGQITSMGMGLGFAAIADPANGVQVPVISQFYNLMGMLLFLAFDGHLVAISVLAESFRALPIGGGGIGREGFWHILAWAGWIFAGALLIALPVVASILVINISFGIMSKAAPQMNVFAVGFPISITLGLALIFAALPNFDFHVKELVDSALLLMRELIGQR